MSASALVVAIGACARARDDGAGDRARMALLAELEDDVGEIALGRLCHHVGGARAVAAHAHVERPVEPEREAALGLVELHRGDAEIEHDAVDRSWPNFCGDVDRAPRSAPRPASVVHRPTAPDPAPCATALWSRSMPMTCAIGRREDRARVAAGAERAVDIDAAVADVQKLDSRPREHGNVTGRSASDSGPSLPAIIPVPRRIFRRSLEAAAILAARAVRVAPMTRARKRPGSQIEIVTACRRETAYCIGFPSIGYARHLGLFGSTSKVWARDRSGVERPHREPNANRIKRGLSLRNRLQSRTVVTLLQHVRFLTSSSVPMDCRITAPEWVHQEFLGTCASPRVVCEGILSS